MTVQQHDSVPKFAIDDLKAIESYLFNQSVEWVKDFLERNPEYSDKTLPEICEAFKKSKVFNDGKAALLDAKKEYTGPNEQPKDTKSFHVVSEEILKKTNSFKHKCYKKALAKIRDNYNPPAKAISAKHKELQEQAREDLKRLYDPPRKAIDSRMEKKGVGEYEAVEQLREKYKPTKKELQERLKKGMYGEDYAKKLLQSEYQPTLEDIKEELNREFTPAEAKQAAKDNYNPPEQDINDLGKIGKQRPDAIKILRDKHEPTQEEKDKYKGLIYRYENSKGQILPTEGQNYTEDDIKEVQLLHYAETDRQAVAQYLKDQRSALEKKLQSETELPDLVKGAAIGAIIMSALPNKTAEIGSKKTVDDSVQREKVSSLVKSISSDLPEDVNIFDYKIAANFIKNYAAAKNPKAFLDPDLFTKEIIVEALRKYKVVMDAIMPEMKDLGLNNANKKIIEQTMPYLANYVGRDQDIEKVKGVYAQALKERFEEKGSDLHKFDKYRFKKLFKDPSVEELTEKLSAAQQDVSKTTADYNPLVENKLYEILDKYRQESDRNKRLTDDKIDKLVNTLKKPIVASAQKGIDPKKLFDYIEKEITGEIRKVEIKRWYLNTQRVKGQYTIHPESLELLKERIEAVGKAHDPENKEQAEALMAAQNILTEAFNKIKEEAKQKKAYEFLIKKHRLARNSKNTVREEITENLQKALIGATPERKKSLKIQVSEMLSEAKIKPFLFRARISKKASIDISAKLKKEKSISGPIGIDDALAQKKLELNSIDSISTISAEGATSERERSVSNASADSENMDDLAFALKEYDRNEPIDRYIANGMPGLDEVNPTEQFIERLENNPEEIEQEMRDMLKPYEKELSNASISLDELKQDQLEELIVARYEQLQQQKANTSKTKIDLKEAVKLLDSFNTDSQIFPKNWRQDKDHQAKLLEHLGIKKEDGLDILEQVYAAHIEKTSKNVFKGFEGLNESSSTDPPKKIQSFGESSTDVVNDSDTSGPSSRSSSTNSRDSGGAQNPASHKVAESPKLNQQEYWQNRIKDRAGRVKKPTITAISQ